MYGELRVVVDDDDDDEEQEREGREEEEVGVVEMEDVVYVHDADAVRLRLEEIVWEEEEEEL